MIWWRRRWTLGIGANRSGSTPTGTMKSFSGLTPWVRQMSSKEFCDTVMIRWSRWATRVCILVKAYQRLFDQRWPRVSACSISMRRSTVIGWWIVPSTGQAGSARSRSRP